MFNIDASSSRPIYEQIIDTVKEQIQKGLLNPGDQLPPVRQLAGILSINPNTVSRAYQELEHQHIIETLRGKGTFICMHLQINSEEEQITRLNHKLKDLCIQYHSLGFTQNEIFSQIEQILNELQKGNQNDRCR